MNEGSSKQGSWLLKLSEWFNQEPKDRDDLLEEIKEAYNNQIIDVDAWRMLQGVLALSALRVQDVMVPRAQMMMLSQRDDLANWLKIIVDSQHSRFPVTGENKDSLVGILMTKDLLMAYIRGQVDSIESVNAQLRPVFYVPETKRAIELLREFQSRHLHMAVAVDEYGSITGLITIEDIIEAIVGEIEDEYDKIDVHILQIDDKTFTVKAITPVEEVNRFFNVSLDTEAADTVAGLLVSHFGRVPHTGESLVYEGLLFKVLRADRRRVQLFKVSFVEKVESH